MAIDVVLGLQRGDEGKGRFVDMLAANYDIVARFNGGPNAGHTIAGENLELRLHQIPSGITQRKVVSIIGNGSYVDPVKLVDELKEVEQAGFTVSPHHFVISSDAHLILPHHISLDEIREAGQQGQGSTKSGIAYVAADKYRRSGVRTETLLDEGTQLQRYISEQLESIQPQRSAAGLTTQNIAAVTEAWLTSGKRISPYVGNTLELLHSALSSKKDILAEGAQATGLDIEHGMYPFVTSSHTTTGGVLNGLGVGPQHIRRVIGVAKVLRSHVGGGPFVTKEVDSAKAALIRGKKGLVDSEYGATTGRERQVGYLDLPELKRAILVNGVTELALTKLDTLSRLKNIPVAISYRYRNAETEIAPSSAHVLEQCEPVYKELSCWKEDISNARNYDELPIEAKSFVSFIEETLGVPVTMIGVGPYRSQVIQRMGL